MLSCQPMRQLSLIPNAPLHHGGELARGRRKSSRPLTSRKPLHLVLKARFPLRRHRSLISGEAHRLAEKFCCRIYDIAVASDHVHLVLKISGRKEYCAFIRSLTGLLARKIKRRLFLLMPFTRIANWGKDFARLKGYLRQNREEAAGERPYEPRVDWYRRYRKK